MRFCDLFIAYKLGLKELKTEIPFTQLPLWKKIVIIIYFTFTILCATMVMLKKYYISLGIFAVLMIFITIIAISDSTMKNKKTMLKNHYIPYSIERMNMVISILKKYKINITDIDSINLLINEAKNAQAQNDNLTPLKGPFKTLGAVVIPIIIFVAQKIDDRTNPEEMLFIAICTIILIILGFGFILLLMPIIKNIFYLDYNKYNEFISDLTQIKIFYSKQTTLRSSNN